LTRFECFCKDHEDFLISKSVSSSFVNFWRLTKVPLSPQSEKSVRRCGAAISTTVTTITTAFTTPTSPENLQLSLWQVDHNKNHTWPWQANWLVMMVMMMTFSLVPSFFSIFLEVR